MKKKKFQIKNFVLLTIAGIVNATGVVIFLVPLNLIDSGISGTSFLLDKLTPQYLTLSIFLIVLNFPFYLIGFKKMGKMFVVYSLYAISVYSLMAFIYRSVLPINLSFSPIAGNDMLLASIFGGLISGIGSGLVIRYGGAIDGVEVMAVLFSKRLHVTVGTFVMIYNAVLYTVSAIIFKSWAVPLYSVIAYAVGGKTVDFIVEGIDKGKGCFIITNKGAQIAEKLSKELKRGITFLNAKGYYSNEKKDMLYCIVNRFEIYKLKKLVHDTDEQAFISVFEISEVIKKDI